MEEQKEPISENENTTPEQSTEQTTENSVAATQPSSEEA